MSKRRRIIIDVDKILYVLMKRNNAEIHVYGGDIYVTRITIDVGDIKFAGNNTDVLLQNAAGGD